MGDSDLAVRGQVILAAAWALVGGSAGWVIGSLLHQDPAVALTGFVVGAAVLGSVSGVVQRAASATVAILFSTRGKPGSPEYSLAASHEARADYGRAAAELQKQPIARPGDALPCVLLGRLHRDRLLDYESASAWFRRAIDRTAEPGAALGLLRELSELHAVCLGQPERSLPELARFAARFPDTPAANWARLELTHVKERVNWGH